jgi:hypothetical protein
MKNVLSIVSTLFIGLALTLTACGKDKKEPAKTEPAMAEPAKAEPAMAEPPKAEPAMAEPAKMEPAKAEPAAGEPKPEAKGGW